MRQPKPSAPRIPASYGVPTDASGGERLPWSWAVERLVSSRNYWISTTRRDGRPHAAPVWGLWMDDAAWFSTARSSQKARNLARAPSVVVHLESGDEVVILEGDVHEEREPEALERFGDAYEAKYGFRPEPDSEGAAVFVLRPRTAQTWLESEYPKTATRWVFE